MMQRVRLMFTILVLVLGTAIAQAGQTTVAMPNCFGGCGGYLNADPALGGQPVAFPCSFDDPVPPGATVQALTITASDGNGREYTWMGTPTVGYSIDGQQLGSPQLITNFAGRTCSGFTTHFWASDYYPSGFPGYVYGGSNNVIIYVTGGEYSHAVLNLTVQYDFVLTMTPVSGSDQTGSVGSALELPLVARMTGPPGFSVAGRPVIFFVGTEPNHASGTAIGAAESATSRTYETVTDDQGYARATAVLGSADGAYTFTATSGVYTSTPATFTATAKKPSSVAILKDSYDLATRLPAYTLLFDNETRLTAIGLDKTGKKIGPLKVSWSVNSPTGNFEPTVPASTARFVPVMPGQATVKASPTISGVPNATVDTFLTGLYLARSTFSLATRLQDDCFKTLIPGTTASGSSVPLNEMPQQLMLHALTGGLTGGQVEFKISNPSSFPGLAMNYPIPGPVDDDVYLFTPTGPRTKTATFTGNETTSIAVYFNDYAAAAGVSLTISYNGKSYPTTIPIQVPLDEDGNRLPDTGWLTYPNGHVASAGLTADGDVDAPISTTNTVAGDGLSNFEEYRGFSVGGQHVRTDARAKDLFLDADPGILVEMQALSAFQQIPLKLHYLDANEVSGASVSNRFERVRPVMNPNRNGVPGVRLSGKRAVRIVYQVNTPPVLQDPLTQRNYAAPNVGYLGITIPDEFGNLYTLNSPDNTAAIHSPDHVQAVELYPVGFNRALHTDFAGVYRDAAGSPVPDCTSVPAGTPCDNFDFANGLIHPYIESVPGLELLNFQLHTVLEPARYPFPDWYTKDDSHTCSGGVVPQTSAGLSDDEMIRLRAAYSLHELGHAMHMEHVSLCGNVMYDNVPATPRETMADVLPIFLSFTTLNLDQVVLTEP